MAEVSAEVSKSFDEKYYLEKYPEVARSGLTPLRHYLEIGWKEGKNPSPNFVTSYYLEQYPDVRASGKNPLVHFVTQGRNEGRSAHRNVLYTVPPGKSRVDTEKALREAFDAAHYCAAYPQLKLTPDTAFEHFMRQGWRESRNPSPQFNTSFYLQNNPELRKSGVNPFFHYVVFGRAEGRPAHPQQQNMRPGKAAAPGGSAIQRAEIDLLAASGIFDAGYYRATYADLAGLSDTRLIERYFYQGWRENRNPSRYFDSQRYLAQARLTSGGGTNPVIHYLKIGEGSGLTPTAWFQPKWYVTQPGVQLAPGQTALEHYIHTGRHRRLPPNDRFDCNFYLARNPDIEAQGGDPWLHYLTAGYRERRDPSATFDALEYCRRHRLGPGEDPLIHSLVHAVETERTTGRAAADVFEAALDFGRPSPLFEERKPGLIANRNCRAKAIAFYLPQFHCVAENDAAWGKGFTEWRNAVRGLPRFAGHYQPRVPQELGFYDLAQSDVMRRQIGMAQAAGIFGFCFYYYWFNGKRLLEKPVDGFLSDPSLKMPFAIMYANENWTRRWDGFDEDVIFHQDYRPEDERPLLADLSRHFSDPRYIRIGGRPFFIIYRPGLIPDTAATIARWRRIWRDDFGVDPLIMMVQGFGEYDPRSFGADGAVEFPPHKVASGLPPINGEMELFDHGFSKRGGTILSYDDMVASSLAVAPPPHPLVRGVTPSWDNEARRPGQGAVYHGSTPAKYESWLRQLSHFACENPVAGESLVMVNAWNEWAEAAYLEPDVHFGAAYLNATARALTANGVRIGKDKIVVMSHDAHPHGAQLNAMHMAEVLGKQFGFEVALISLGDGPLLGKFAEVAETHQVPATGKPINDLVASLKDRGFNAVLANTAVSGAAIPAFKARGFRVVSLVHELPRLIAEYGLQQAASAIASKADRIVFAAPEVRDGFMSVVPASADKTLIRPQGSYRDWVSAPEKSAALRAELGLDATAKLVINVGFADSRKGFDIFLAVAKLLIAKRSDIHFLWVGGGTPDVVNWLASDAATDAKLASRFTLRPFTDDVVPVYEAADLYFLSSREDPFPTSVLEAMQAGLPVVGLEGSGGAVRLIAQYGRVAPRSDMLAAADAVESLLDLPEAERQSAAAERRRVIDTEFRFDDYVYDLARLAGFQHGKVSVVVPNYNYAAFLSARLDSIMAQSHPLFETIVLDDKSTDASLAAVEAYEARTGARLILVVNEANSGSGYRQWDKGAALARGDYVWIAEADDLCEPAFLDRAMSVLENSDAAFVFCDSRQIDETGRELAASYQYYYKDVGGGGLDRDVILPGPEFVRRYLSVKNVILNVSSVLWRRDALIHALAAARDGFASLKVASDWKMYAIAALECGAVGFIAEPLNVHRRHAQSVTHARGGEAHFAEIAAVQDFIEARVALDKETLFRREAYRREVSGQLLPPVPIETAKKPAKPQDAGDKPSTPVRRLRVVE